jgi:hypothetical protein
LGAALSWVKCWAIKVLAAVYPLVYVGGYALQAQAHVSHYGATDAAMATQLVWGLGLCHFRLEVA